MGTQQDLTKTIGTCRTVEVTFSHAHAIQNGNLLAELDFNEIRKRSLQHKIQPRTQTSKIINKCKFCSYSHKRGSCPAYGKSSNNCKKKGRFDFVQQNMDNSDSDSELFDNCKSLFIDVVEDEENSSSENEWTIDLLVNQALLSFKIDSGDKPILSQKTVLEPQRTSQNYINRMLN